MFLTFKICGEVVVLGPEREMARREAGVVAARERGAARHQHAAHRAPLVRRRLVQRRLPALVVPHVQYRSRSTGHQVLHDLLVPVPRGHVQRRLAARVDRQQRVPRRVQVFHHSQISNFSRFQQSVRCFFQ